MKNLKLFEAWEFGNLPKMLGKVEFKAGDIVNVNGHEVIVLRDPEVKMSNKRPLSFSYVYLHDLKGDRTKVRIMGIQMSIAPKKIRAGKPADLKLALEIEREKSESHSKAVGERQDRNYGQIKFEKNPNNSNYVDQCVVMQDGNLGFANDEVIVKFSNGLFPGKIKFPFTTNKLGEIMVNFNRSSKARGIPPKMIMNKKK